MAFRRTAATIALLLTLLAVEACTEEECSSPSSIDEFRNMVIDAVCSMNETTGRAFRNQTRLNHGAGHKSDGECMYYTISEGALQGCPLQPHSGGDSLCATHL